MRRYLLLPSRLPRNRLSLSTEVAAVVVAVMRVVVVMQAVAADILEAVAIRAVAMEDRWQALAAVRRLVIVAELPS